MVKKGVKKFKKKGWKKLNCGKSVREKSGNFLKQL